MTRSASVMLAGIAISPWAAVASATEDPTGVVPSLAGPGPSPDEIVLLACDRAAAESCGGTVTWPANAASVTFYVSSCASAALESCSGFTGSLAITLDNAPYGDHQAWACYFEAGLLDQCALLESSDPSGNIHNGFTVLVEGHPDPIGPAQLGPLGAWHFWEVARA